MLGGAIPSPSQNGIVPTPNVDATMQNTGISVRSAMADDLNNPFFPWGAHCDKCKRWYNPDTPHICEPELMDKVVERRKLLRWLGEGAEQIGGETP